MTSSRGDLAARGLAADDAGGDDDCPGFSGARRDCRRPTGIIRLPSRPGGVRC
ncbi:MAG: hypothetical protein ACKV0T_12885 [Planctomycetales bacterium]